MDFADGKDMSLPFVSAMIVVRNEENRIGKCVSSLINQDYPYDRYEVIIIDGESEDGTLQVISDELSKADAAPKLRIIDNPGHILASGWNLGIRAARGKYVIRIDAHAFADTDFLRKNVEVMERMGDAACVGGQMMTLSDTRTGEIIKEALSNPFGIGGAKFRYAKTAGYVDTVAYGLYRRDVFDKIGFFNEKLIRTQDNDLHRRMRDAGMKFYLDPEICSYYYSRDSYKKLIKQQFNNGKWTMINFLLRPGKMSIRHFVPLLFVLAELGTAVFGLFFHPFWWLTIAGIAAHLMGGLFFAARHSKKLSHVLILPLVFLLIHIVYGVGSIAGVFTAPKMKAT